MKVQRQDITASIISQNLIPEPHVDTPFGTVQFHCPNKEALEYPRTLMTREPDTIDWIGKFSKGEVFWDIGANVGAYSLIAALVTKNFVLAFEPSGQTFSLLVNNIKLNNLNEIIWPFCIAFSNKTQLDFLNIPNAYASSVFNVFGDENDTRESGNKSLFRQKVPGFSIDDFIKIYNPPLPNHIKIDVDSIELQILKGAEKLLKNNAVKSILVEVVQEPGSRNYKSITDLLKFSGFESRANDNSLKNENIIFTRT